MTITADTQFGRRVGLLLRKGDKVLDLSAMHFKFNTVQDDNESPANCSIRVYNLSAQTTADIQKEYQEVILQAGYGSNFGVIFAGTIKQYKKGREPDALSTYLDILAADGDESYQFGICGGPSLAAGTTDSDKLAAIMLALSAKGTVEKSPVIYNQYFGGILPRGKVAWGLARTQLRSWCRNQGATWSIQDGKVQIIPLTSYLPGQEVTLNSKTGLIGRVEQTQEGMKCRALLNPKLTVGGVVKINQASINTTTATAVASLSGTAQLPFNQRAPKVPNLFANIDADGSYRIYQAEYVGDTRGQDFYVDLIGLTIHADTNQVKAFG